MFFEPTVEAVNGTTDFVGDVGDGRVGVENATDGVLSNFGGVVITGHGAKERWKENDEIILRP
jgi:hypothetical protein